MSDRTNDGSERRRDRHDIVREILDYATEGRIKTHIMYKARLSYAQLKEYLPLLVDKKFLEKKKVKQKNHESVIYQTTPSGSILLESLQNAKKGLENSSLEKINI